MSDTGVEATDEFSYVDKSTGRRATFTPKADEAMVSLDRAATSDTLDGVVALPSLLSISQGYNLERGFAAVFVAPSADMATAVDALDSVPDVAGSIPVMVDEHGASRYFLPDELTV